MSLDRPIPGGHSYKLDLSSAQRSCENIDRVCKITAGLFFFEKLRIDLPAVNDLVSFDTPSGEKRGFFPFNRFLRNL
jgi:hypothetical protein